MPREKDVLTQLYTPQYIDDDLNDELIRARRFGRDLGLLLLEPKIPESVRIDMGYPVLKKLAVVCRELTRQVDDGVRLGNQILLVLPETGLEGVDTAADKIAGKFAESSFTHPSTGETFAGEFWVAKVVCREQEDSAQQVLGGLKQQLSAAKGDKEE